jgi:predicted Ser/Thr protein kinase
VDATEKKKIGKYEITGILGRGGMGVVYRAEDKRIGRLVAIKTLTEGFSGQPEMLERFYREAQAGILQHANIVIVYDLGDEDGIPFIVMEYVEGDPLDKLIASGRQLPLVEKLSIIEQVCAALGYAHQRGVVHRDIKPANVIVQPDGHAKIFDFGIARVQSSSADGGLTRTGNVIGTIHYIAPERLKGLPFDGRADIFSAGVMLYLLLAGQLPFTGEDMAVLQKLVNEPAPPLKNYITSYPPELDAILDRALAKDPSQRYATAEDFAADLHALSEGLKKGQASELFGDAERLTGEQQFGRAREVLLQLVRIDPQHTGARQLLGVVQQNLARLQRTDQVRQLVAEAEEALASARFLEALNSLDQAIKLDPGNADLQSRLENAREKKRRADEVGDLMSQADSLRARGDWSGALNVVEKALQLDRENPAVHSAYAEITKKAKLAAQQGKIRELIDNARHEVTSRHFTAAIEILREVGKIDPSLPELDSLMDTAVRGQEQDRRRRLIEQIQTEIENCLAAQDFDRATELVERALEKLPTESSLLQLKSRVAVQSREFHARRLIETTATAAQEAFQNSPGEALLIVQRALQELPGEERLLALEHSMRQRLKAAEMEEVRGRYLRESQQAIDSGQFDKAIEVLESYQFEFADSAGVSELLEYARKGLGEQQRRSRITACVSQAQSLMKQEQYDHAIRLLEPALAQTPDPTLERLLAESRSLRQEAERKAEALLARVSRLRERGQLDDAIDLIQGMPAASISGTPLNALLSEIRAEQARKQATSSALAAASQARDFGAFQAAIESLQGVQSAWGESAEVAHAISEIDSRRAQLANETVAKSIETARAALLANDSEAALQQLRGVAEWVDFAGATQQADWRRLGNEAAKPKTRKTGNTVTAIAFDTAASSTANQSAPAPPRRKLLIPLMAGAALLVVAAVIAIWFHFQSVNQVEQAKLATQRQTNSPPAPPTGVLLVHGNVDNAEIFVDDLLMGFTQSDGSLNLPLDPGTHSIRLVKIGFTDVPPTSVTISANSQATMEFSMTASNSGAPVVETVGFLTVRSTPGATLSIDHGPQQKVSARGNVIVQVKPGTHLLDIGLDGYQAYEQSFNIKAGEKNNIAAPLTRIPAPSIPAVAPKPQTVQILAFSATASQIDQGQPTTLQWQTANASEVSIDNGIARVDNSGQTTVRPQTSTIYVLTAKGAGGTQQRSVSVFVESKAEKSQSAAPSLFGPNDEPARVQQALSNFESAWNAHDIARIRETWSGISSQQVNALESFFKDEPNAKVSDDCSLSNLKISGNTAKWSCTETTTIVVGGKPQASAHNVQITFSKKNGSWFSKKSGTWTVAERR